MNPTNPNKKLWFKRKRYGWGWTPITWQGWLATLLYVLCIVAFAQDIQPGTSLQDVTFSLIAPIIFVTILFIALAYKKGEKPRWQWGNDNRL